MFAAEAYTTDGYRKGGGGEVTQQRRRRADGGTCLLEFLALVRWDKVVVE